MTTCFVTGATGAIGGAVVARLLEDPGMRVIALVRADSPRAAASRLDRIIEASARLRAVRGDVELPRMGLSDADHDSLVAGCSHVIHCAGAVRMNLPLAAARRAAVDAARNVLQLGRALADAGRLEKIELVSTVGVAGRAHRLLQEDWVGAEHSFHNSYEQAKAEAEQVAHEGVRAGLPLTVHRPSMVVGHSQTGAALHFQVFYFLAEFLSGRRTRGFFPQFGAARLDTVPVDFVAEAIVRSSSSKENTGKILHLCAGPQDALTLQRLQSVVQAALAALGRRAPKPRYVPRRVFRAAVAALQLFADARQRSALATLPVFLDYLETDQAFENARSVDWMRRQGIPVPRAEDYLPRVLEFYFRSVR